jgi:HTH-type transcriptional regulator/antitoxin HipB
MEYLAITPRQLAQVLRGYRKSRQLTQAQAARLGGLLQKTVSNLELVPERTSVESLFKLFSALNLELVLREKSAPSRPDEPA